MERPAPDGHSGGANLLEPAMGIGHFFGLMPEDLLPGSHRTGVELDAITARIAQKLYPDATIFAKGLEDAPLPDDFFDAIVGNVPFGEYAVHDPDYKRAQTRAIHDYFFAKSVDKLRPRGLLALISSRYTMDKQDSAMRQYPADRGELTPELLARAVAALPKACTSPGTKAARRLRCRQPRAACFPASERDHDN